MSSPAARTPSRLRSLYGRSLYGALLLVVFAGLLAPAVVGGDRDAHGCIGSAGYAWCARSATCERPWELAEREGIENTAPAVEAWCAAPADAPQSGNAPAR